MAYFDGILVKIQKLTNYLVLKNAQNFQFYYFKFENLI